MINLPPTIPVNNSDRVTIRKLTAQPVDRANTISNDVNAKPVLRPRLERRKHKDRRRDRSEFPIDSRSGKDRRRSAKKNQPTIDIRA